MDSADSGQGPVVMCCEKSNELLGSAKRGSYQMRDYQLLKMAST